MSIEIDQVLRDINDQHKRSLALLERHCEQGGTFRVTGPNQRSAGRWKVYLEYPDGIRAITGGRTMLDAMANAAQLLENAERAKRLMTGSQETGSSSDNG